MTDFYADKKTKQKIEEVTELLNQGKVTSHEAAKKIIETHRNGKKNI